MCIPITRIVAASLLLLFLPLSGFAQETDTDNDGIVDGTDNCPAIANEDQTDTDSDGSGDACDSDDDNDSIVDAEDLYPLDNTKHQNTPYVITFEGIVDYVSDSVEGKEPHQIKSGDTYRYTLVFDNHNGALENQTWGRTFANSDIEYLLLTIEGESSGTLMVDVANMRPIPGLFGSSLNSIQGTSGLDIETDGTGALSKVWNDVTFLGLGDDIRLDWYQSYGWIAPNVAAAIRLQARSATVAESSSSYTTQSSWAFTGIDQAIRVEDPTQWSAVTPATCAGPLTLSTQVDVDAVLTNVCTRIEGDLILDGTAIRDLSPLRLVRTIDGQLTITPDMSAPTLNGLQGVSHINGEAVVDSDGDYHPDFMDDYPNDSAAAFDTDGDGLPNDWLPGKFSSSVDPDLTVDTDDDGDGTVDYEDDLPLDASDTVDTDRDGIGNNADNDDDGDGIEDVLDAFPLDVAASVDDDQDGAPDAWNVDATEVQIAASELSLDAFPGDGSETTDTDSDGTGNNADLDDDNDTYPDTEDDFPLDATEWLDTDGDGIGNNADPNDDNDAIPDENDAFPLDPTEVADRDGDGIGNNSDPDLDGDGVDNELDAFPYTPGEWADTDGDFIGDNADTDDDNDSVPDTEDAFPLDASESVDTDGDGVGDNDDIDSALGLITDSNFNACLAELGVDRVSEVTSLSCRSREIGSLQGIGVLSALTELDLTSNSSLNDFTMLAELPSLRSLSLEAIPLGDNTSLSALTLESLNVAQANLSSLEGFLPDPTVLRELNLSRNSISDISALHEYSELRRLDIQGNNGVIASFPSTLALLSDLNVIDTGVTAVSELPSYLAESLERLYIRSNDANEPFDLTGLDFFTRLNYLNATYSYVDWISAEGFDSTGLELHVTGSYFSSLQQLGPAFEKTRVLIVDRSYLTDLAGIEVMNDLELFAARQAQINDISALDKSIEKLYLDDNEITDISSLSELYVDVFSGELSLAGNPIRKIGDTLRDWRTPRLDLSRTDVSCEEIAYVESYLTPQISVIWPENCISDPDRDYFYGDEDAFPNDSAASVDTDNDGAPDAWNEGATQDQITASGLTLDAFPNDPAASVDTDLDGAPDAWNENATDEQIAGSELLLDVFPVDGSETIDTDGDGTGNNADTDDDNDGVADDDDVYPLDASESLDTDGDGIGNNADADDDADGVDDALDAFPLDAAESVDTDGDGIGNNADSDDDGDSLSDLDELDLGLQPLNADSDGDGLSDGEDQTHVLIESVFPRLRVTVISPSIENIERGSFRLISEASEAPMVVFYPVEIVGGMMRFEYQFHPNTRSGTYRISSTAAVYDGGEITDSNSYALDIQNEESVNTTPTIEDYSLLPSSDGNSIEGYVTVGSLVEGIGRSRPVGSDTRPNFDIQFRDSFGENVNVRVGYRNLNVISETVTRVDVRYDIVSDADAEDLRVRLISLADEAINGLTSTIDADDDGAIDLFDRFPANASEYQDNDRDGVGDNGDAFPQDVAASLDTDGDGFPDAWNVDATDEQIGSSDLVLDVFPEDESESVDSDLDGVGDNGDAFPNNPNESVDADQDGVGANTDVDDNDPESDSDNDGLSDSAEREYGSNPLLDDTDGDGFTDGEEVAAGTSPTDIEDIPMVDEEDEIRGFPLWLIEVLKARESASAP